MIENAIYFHDPDAFFLGCLQKRVKVTKFCCYENVKMHYGTRRLIWLGIGDVLPHENWYKACLCQDFIAAGRHTFDIVFRNGVAK